MDMTALITTAHRLRWVLIAFALFLGSSLITTSGWLLTYASGITLGAVVALMVAGYRDLTR